MKRLDLQVWLIAFGGTGSLQAYIEMGGINRSPGR